MPPRIDHVISTAVKYLKLYRVASPPVDIWGILDHMRIPVLSGNLHGLDGTCYPYIRKDGKVRFYVLVDDGTHFNRTRIRYTLTHEFAHIVLNHHFDHSLRRPEKDQEAEVFAAHFLMPEYMFATVGPEVLTPKGLYELVTRFDVSWATMLRRLEELGIQSVEQSQRILDNRTSLRRQKEDIL